MIDGQSTGPEGRPRHCAGLESIAPHFAYMKGGEALEHVETLVQIIKDVGFPILAWLICIKQLDKEREAHAKESDNYAQALNKYTTVLERLTIYLERSTPDNDHE